MMLHTQFLYFRTNTGNNPAKALELVRAALQPSLNADIEKVLSNYQEVSVGSCANVWCYFIKARNLLTSEKGLVVKKHLILTTIRRP